MEKDPIKTSWEEFENRPLDQPGLWEKSRWPTRAAMVAAGLIFIKAAINPVTHQLTPEIGAEDDEKAGQIVGFHYRKTSWWGFRKQDHNAIRFKKSGPQYFDRADDKWHEVPPEAWGVKIEDDRTFEADNRGYHEQ